MKKIIFVHPVDDLYGASRILAYVINSLDSEEYDCDIIVPRISGDLQSIIKNPSVKFVEMPCLPIIHRKMFTPLGVLKWVINNFKFYSFLRKNKGSIKLVYVNTFACFSVSFLSKLSSLSVLTHCHEVLDNSPHGKFISYCSKKFSDVVVCVSNRVKNYVSGIDNSKNVLLIYNGIPDVECYKQRETFSRLDKNDVYNFYLVGRVMPEKGHWFLLDTIKKLPSSLLKGVKFHIVGDSPPNRKGLFDEFKNEVNKNNLNECFVFHGFIQDISENLSTCCDVLLVPSIMADPFPTTVLEGLRAGIPVITTNNGGAAEIIENGVNGFLIEPGNINEFGDIITKILDDNMDLLKVSVFARLSYERNFSLDNFSKSIVKIIATCIK
ncbi:glycosyltransferase family 4 protein [Pragia fontium]|uniref:Glycosyl transferase n=1 Tax=Pragia fontium TaxID=82985 RepID=A0ABQ5LKT2_9GAMM|nr:glycosyltransferase family 4 protein [Pragia fontium]GKX63859.1 glycosyl transferase [Pragia fontium]VEJ56166.1 Spore coat protein SA [Pragia fontium]